MWRLMFCFAGCDATAAPPTGAPPPAATQAVPAATGPIRQAYESLLATCASGALPVWTPMEARILRNTPYAVAGLRFTDADLTAVFSADGGWYRPTTDTPRPLGEVDAACVAALAARERSLRSSWPVPADFEARMVRDHAVFIFLRQSGSSATSPYWKPSFNDEDETMPGVYFPAAECERRPRNEDCYGYGILCPADGPCVSVASG